MDRAAQLLAEVGILGTLCNLEGSGEQRTELVHSLEQYVFVEPEHQIVFESIRSLLPHDRISAARLAVHLNNRGFPDVDLEHYYSLALSDMEDALKLARGLCSLAQGRNADVRRGKIQE
jgi:hypothetical protein